MESLSYSKAGKAVEENGSSFEFSEFLSDIPSKIAAPDNLAASSGPSSVFLTQGLETECVKSSDQVHCNHPDRMHD